MGDKEVYRNHKQRGKVGYRQPPPTEFADRERGAAAVTGEEITEKASGNNTKEAPVWAWVASAAVAFATFSLMMASVIPMGAAESYEQRRNQNSNAKEKFEAETLNRNKATE